MKSTKAPRTLSKSFRNTVDWDFYVTKWSKMQEWSRLPASPFRTDTP